MAVFPQLSGEDGFKALIDEPFTIGSRLVHSTVQLFVFLFCPAPYASVPISFAACSLDRGSSPGGGPRTWFLKFDGIVTLHWVAS